MSSYSTQQRKALLAYLSRHPDELLSARQIADALADEKISLSAVYRNLAQLEAEEKVQRTLAALGVKVLIVDLPRAALAAAAHFFFRL